MEFREVREERDRAVREEVRSGGWHRWVMRSGEVVDVSGDQVEAWMARVEAEAGAAGDEGRMAEAAAARWRGAAAWGAYLAPPPRAGEWRAAEDRAATMVREAGVAAFEAEEARGEILAAAGWKAAADRAVDKLSAQLRMVADAVEWVVEEWATAEAERALGMEAE